MVVVHVLRELAEAVVVGLCVARCVRHQLVDGARYVVAVVSQCLYQVVVCQVVVDERASVALVVAVVEPVAELQVSPLGDGFAVCGLYGVVAVACRCGVVAVVDVVVHARGLPVADKRCGELLALAVVEATSESEGDVSSFVVQLAVELQFAVHATAAAVSLLARVAGVHDHVGDSCNFFLALSQSALKFFLCCVELVLIVAFRVVVICSGVSVG